MPAIDFSEVPGLTITETIATAMRSDGITRPTPIQQRTMAAVLAGEHVLMHSGTGTGKTLAYLLPILQRLRESPGRAVIFAPGAELVMQTLKVISAYKDAELTAEAALTTTSHRRQRKRVVRSTRLVVGTPDRLLEMFRGRKLKGVTIVVLDEIEPILGAKDADFLYEVLSRPEPKRQLIVASATMGQRSAAFVERFMADGVQIHAAERPIQSAISHLVVRVPPSRAKEVALASFIENNRCTQAIVFAADPRHHRHLYHYLNRHNITATTVSRERTKNQRQRGLRDFRQGRARVLITTDAAARGIDVPDVQWVLHYDLPRSLQAYIHRAGRTGRAGQKGCSVVFSDRSTQGSLRRLMRELNIEFSAATIS